MNSTCVQSIHLRVYKLINAPTPPQQALPGAAVRSLWCREWVWYSWTVYFGTFSDNQVLVKVKAQHPLISHCVEILTHSSSGLFSRNRTLASKRLGSGDWLARAFGLAWKPHPPLPRLRRHPRNALLGSAGSLGLGASQPSWEWTMIWSSGVIKPVKFRWLWVTDVQQCLSCAS